MTDPSDTVTDAPPFAPPVPAASGVLPTPETAPATVPELAAAHAANATAIADLQSAHLTVLDKLEALADRVEGLVEHGIKVAETGVLGAPIAEGAGLLQEVINFLHHTFPGHGVPGEVKVIAVEASV